MTQVQKRQAEALLMRNRRAIDRATIVTAPIREASRQSDEALKAIRSALRRSVA